MLISRLRRASASAATAPLLSATIALGIAAGAAADTYRVTLPPGVAAAGSSGRVILFFTDTSSRRLAQVEPREAPFFSDPQPVASIGVDKLLPGGVVEIGDAAVAWPVPLSQLSGEFRVQAVFKCNRDEASHQAPGNPYSDVATVALAADRDDTVELRLTKVDAPRDRSNPGEREPRPETQPAGQAPTERAPAGAAAPDDDGLDAALREHLVWITLRSDLLSRHWGRDTFLRCGVALPKGYHDVNHPRRSWPAIYVVPGFGGRDRGAVRYVRMLHTRGAEELAPPAVHIVLDPEGPYGHHGFADSVANGPVGTALVTELIPYLERRFRLIAKPEARFVTGHSSGAWSALWLTLHAPETFGGCWASAPDPVDFHAFQMTDLYRDPSLFEMADGTDTPSFRTPAAPGVDKVRMTVRQEIGVEHAMAPDGDSGQQWGAWLAMFSALDATTGKPRWMIDPVAGTIHPEVIALDWSKYDIAKLVDADWERYKAILPRIRLAVGTQDSFYLNRAVTRWRNALAQRQAPTRATSDGATPAAATAPAELPADGEMTLGDGPGYIWIIRNATHDSIMAPTTLRWAKEMRQAIEQSGL